VKCLIFSALIMLAACASPPEPLNIENTEKLTATVEAVDQTKRTVTLRAPNGLSQTIEVSPEVRNLAQVEAGDQVVVQYYEGLAAQLTRKGEPATSVGQVDEALLGTRAEPGHKPGGAVGSVVTTTVVIQAVDRSANTVTFEGPEGSRTVSVKRPEAQKFIAGLKQGDEVDITYTEALAVSVQPAR
jgi:hypothetical protein